MAVLHIIEKSDPEVNSEYNFENRNRLETLKLFIWKRKLQFLLAILAILAFIALICENSHHQGKLHEKIGKLESAHMAHITKTDQLTKNVQKSPNMIKIGKD